MIFKWRRTCLYVLGGSSGQGGDVVLKRLVNEKEKKKILHSNNAELVCMFLVVAVAEVVT
jgi:hypothetical protein